MKGALLVGFRPICRLRRPTPTACLRSHQSMFSRRLHSAAAGGAAAAATIQPSSSIRLTSRARPWAINLAFSWLGFQGVSTSPASPDQERMNNLSERHS